MADRLTQYQKEFAVLTILRDALYPMTGHKIGKRIGYANGTPIKQALQHLCRAGVLTAKHGQFMGRPAIWYWMPKNLRQAQSVELIDLTR